MLYNLLRPRARRIGPARIGSIDPGSSLSAELDAVLSGCNRCRRCQRSCAFLQQFGTPYELAERFRDGTLTPETLFSCSLSRLCSAVCPQGLDPARLFRLMRCAMTAGGEVDFRRHRALLRYERLGRFRPFTFFGLPDGCTTVFFPGCTLPGIRPSQFLHLVTLLQNRIDHLGIVMSCCAKPSHDLGRVAAFTEIFGQLHGRLLDAGIHKVLTACPSCHQVFSDYGSGLEITSIYEELEESWQPDDCGTWTDTVRLHDPCSARFNPAMQAGVRSLLAKRGFPLQELPHHGERTLCCGEGGGAMAIDPATAGSWTDARCREARGHRLVTYCAGCTNLLGRRQPTSHIIDLICDPDAAMNGRIATPRAPFTYLNRLKAVSRLKRMLANRVNTASSH